MQIVQLLQHSKHLYILQRNELRTDFVNPVKYNMVRSNEHVSNHCGKQESNKRCRKTPSRHKGNGQLKVDEGKQRPPGGDGLVQEEPSNKGRHQRLNDKDPFASPLIEHDRIDASLFRNARRVEQIQIAQYACKGVTQCLLLNKQTLTKNW